MKMALRITRNFRWKSLLLVLSCSLSALEAKDIFVGPGGAYTSIPSAVESNFPLSEDLMIYVIAPSGQYSTIGTLVPTAAQLNGHSINFQGTTVAPIMTYYVDDHAVFEGGTSIQIAYENMSGANGQEGRLKGGKPNFFIKDHLGSTRYSLNENSGTIEATMYYSYGKMSKLVAGSSPIREKFTTKEFDTEGGVDGRINLNYFGARYYEPEIGMWISPDPLREFPSPYTYVGNNPISSIDPDGRGEIKVNGNKLSSTLMKTLQNSEVGREVIARVHALPQDVIVNARATGKEYHHTVGPGGRAMSVSTTGSAFLRSIGLGWVFGKGDATVEVDVVLSRKYLKSDASTLIMELQNVVDNTISPGMAERMFYKTGDAETSTAIDAAYRLITEPCYDGQ